jgi:hypothetical protein
MQCLAHVERAMPVESRENSHLSMGECVGGDAVWPGVFRRDAETSPCARHLAQAGRLCPLHWGALHRGASSTPRADGTDR